MKNKKTNKLKCPKCNSTESILVFNEENFNILFEIIINLHTRVAALEYESYKIMNLRKEKK